MAIVDSLIDVATHVESCVVDFIEGKHYLSLSLEHFSHLDSSLGQGIRIDNQCLMIKRVRAVCQRVGGPSQLLLNIGL